MFSVQLIPNADICLHCHSGRVGKDELEQIRGELSRTPGYRRGTAHLIVLGPDVDQSDFGFEIAQVEAQSLADHLEQIPGTGVKRIAYICFSSMQATIIRMFAAHLRVRESLRADLETFETLDSAIDWIERNKTAGKAIDRLGLKGFVRKAGHGWCCEESRAQTHTRA